MADPARYDLDAQMNCDGDYSDAVLKVHRSPIGDWIKWHDFLDYKAAQRRNASYDTNVKLGMEVAELRTEIQELKACIKNLEASDAAFRAIAAKMEKNKSTSVSDCSSKP